MGDNPDATNQEPFCPECGYTREDAAMWLDHHLCKGTIPVGENLALRPGGARVIENGMNAWELHRIGMCGDIGHCIYCEEEEVARRSAKRKKPLRKSRKPADGEG